MRIELRAEACVGHGRCYALAPQVFGADEQGHCVVLVRDVPDDLRPPARTAVRNCPEDALTVRD